MRPVLQLALAMLAALPANPALASGGGGGGGGALHFVDMDRMTIPIIDGDRATGRLKIKLVLQAADEAGAARIGATLAALREATLAAAIEFGRLYASPDTPVDARRLAHDIGAVLRAHDHAIVRVLLVEVSASPA